MMVSRFWSAAILTTAGLMGIAACNSSVPVIDTEAPDMTAPDPAEQVSGGVTWGEVASPAGGTVKQLTLSGPESAALVTCDQEGFVPFSYRDTGIDWVGCQVPNPNDPAGPTSALTEPAFTAGPSPVGGTVSMITIPGPQSAIAVVCTSGSPFLYEDQGTWVGCQG
ncbi:MAG: hypothetical protein VKI82_07405 [Leptolyngbya sp.]|nr:hypothetical protein [Leptolyngbya sp.]